MKLEAILEQSGLTKKEARIYLASLELGPSSAQMIAKKAKIKRATTYDVLEALTDKGLVSTIIRSKKRYFIAEDPKRVIKIFKEKQKVLEGALPYLKSIYNIEEIKPAVRFYEGKEGIKAVWEEVLEDRKEALAFSSAEDLFEALPDYFPSFVERRVKLGIPTRVILRESKRARERKRLGPRELREVRIIPRKFVYHAMIVIFGNKIAMFSLKKHFMAVVIESKRLTEVQRAMFEFIWGKLK